MVRCCRSQCSVALLIATLTHTSSFSGWIDPDTTSEHKTLVSYTDGKAYDLVMSDEFNRAGRSFKDGDDPMWTGTAQSAATSKSPVESRLNILLFY